MSFFKVRRGPSGIHFFNRRTGLNILFDEAAVPEADWTPAPRQISIALTNACDLACPHCYAPKTRAKLEFEQITAWLHELDNGGALGVGFGGGEPTVYRQFAELCTYAAGKTGLAVSFTTHGHHLSTELLAELRGNVHFVRVSMDGVGATYERIRGRPFPVLVERLHALRKVSPFGINFVVNADTFPEIDQAVEIVQDIGASEFLLLPEEPVKGIGGITAQTRRDLQRWVSKYSGNLRLAVSERGADGLPICDPFPKETGLRAYAHIDAAGILKRTSYDSDGLKIGPMGVMQAIAEFNKDTGVSP